MLVVPLVVIFAVAVANIRRDRQRATEGDRLRTVLLGSGAVSLNDYAVVFPQACPECLCPWRIRRRQFARVALWYTGDHHEKELPHRDEGQYFGYIETARTDVCGCCRQPISEVVVQTVDGEYLQTHYRSRRDRSPRYSSYTYVNQLQPTTHYYEEPDYGSTYLVEPPQIDNVTIEEISPTLPSSQCASLQGLPAGFFCAWDMERLWARARESQDGCSYERSGLPVTWKDIADALAMPQGPIDSDFISLIRAVYPAASSQTLARVSKF